MKILLIDDRRLFREGVGLLLRRLASDVTLIEASTCDEDFAACDANSDIDLVLLDLNLHGLSGLAGLEVLRERYPEIPVVVLSSAEDEETVRATIDYGAMGFIPKSSSSEIMVNALRLVLAKSIYLPPNVLMHDAFPTAGIGRRTSAAPPGISSGKKPIAPRNLGLTPRQADVLYLVLQGKPINRFVESLGLPKERSKATSPAYCAR